MPRFSPSNCRSAPATNLIHPKQTMSFLPSRLSLTARASLRAASRVAQPMAVRSLSSSVARFEGHHQPIIQGQGAPAGTMPTDEEQSTGLERFELYGKLEGVNVFEMDPLPADRVGTKSDPIKVRSMVGDAEADPVP